MSTLKLKAQEFRIHKTISCCLLAFCCLKREYGNHCNKCEEHLQILKDSEATSSISSSSSLHHKLDYDKLLQLPIKQQALARECSDNCILEGSLRLLDICSTTKECLPISKEIMQELHSVIRRRKGDETGGKYLASRNKLKKTIKMTLRNFKGVKQEQHKQSRWSAISKLMQPRRVASDSKESTTDEYEKVDALVQCFLSHKPSPIECFLSHIENLEMCVQDLEIGTEHLSRKLLRNRVFLINTFNR